MKLPILFLLLAFIQNSHAELAGGGDSVNDVDLTVEGPQRISSIRDLTKTPIESTGPNCWNAALLANGLTDSIHYTSPGEFWHWMNSKQCSSVPANGALRYGDIGSVFSNKTTHFHSFVRVNDDTLFQKGSPIVKHKWEYGKFEEIVFEKYRNEVKNCKGNEASQKSNCIVKVTYHRCKPIPNDFYSQYDDLGPIESQIKKVEQEMLPWMKTHSIQSFKKFESGLLKLSGILSHLKDVKAQGEKEFARKALAFRVAGLLLTDVNEPLYTAQVKKAQLAGADFLDENDPKVSLATLDRSTFRQFRWPSGKSDN